METNKEQLQSRMISKGFSKYDFRNSTMDQDTAFNLAKSIADFYGNEGKVIVGKDYREKSSEIKDATIKGLSKNGCLPKYIGSAPTDMVAYLASEKGVGGLSITASHMPPDYRGIKPLNSLGRIFTNEEYIEVLDYLEKYEDAPNFFETHEPLGEEKAKELYIDGIGERYREIFNNDLSNLTIVVDPGNGVGNITVPESLMELGVSDENIYTVNEEPDPFFSGRGPNPSDSNLEDLSETVLEENADLGVALDGDADRAVFVNEEGEKVEGDETLAILSKAYLENSDLEYAHIACSSNISGLVQDWINENGGAINFQPVGAVYTAVAALNDNQTIYGGQPNGHLLDPGLVPYDSGIMASAAFSGIIEDNNTTVSEIQDNLPNYSIVKTNYKTEDKNKFLDKTLETFEDLNFEFSSQRLNGSLRITFGDEIFILRASETEDVIRAKLERTEQEFRLSTILDKINSE